MIFRYNGSICSHGRRARSSRLLCLYGSYTTVINWPSNFQLHSYESLWFIGHLPAVSELKTVTVNHCMVTTILYLVTPVQVIQILQTITNSVTVIVLQHFTLHPSAIELLNMPTYYVCRLVEAHAVTGAELIFMLVGIIDHLSKALFSYSIYARVIRPSSSANLQTFVWSCMDNCNCMNSI